MSSSKDITMYNEEEIEIVLMALESPISLEFATKEEATYMRSRIYAVRTATIFCWERKEKLKKAGLGVEHLEIPIINSAQEVMSITVRRDSELQITIGRRLIRENIRSVLVAALHKRGRKSAAEKRGDEMDALLSRMKEAKEEQIEAKEDEIYGNLGYKPGVEETSD